MRYEGKLGERAEWNRRLTDNEMKALAAGYSPQFFPDGLIYYRPPLREF